MKNMETEGSPSNSFYESRVTLPSKLGKDKKTHRERGKLEIGCCRNGHLVGGKKVKYKYNKIEGRLGW